MSVRTSTAADALLGITFVRTTIDEAVEAFLREATTHQRPRSYRFINAYSLSIADRDPGYQQLLSSDGCNLPDGRPLTVALNSIHGGTPSFCQVRGPSFFALALDRGRQFGARHALVGGTDELLESLTSEIANRFPGARVALTYSPPFRPLTDSDRVELAQMLARSGANIIWLGLGTPKQDFEATELLRFAPITTASVGAAFDFLAGTKREAPSWVRELALEWLYRLLTEPRRLWRRYFVGNTRFALIIMREWLSTRRKTRQAKTP